ncbi:hypothetical protein M8J76_000501 [Diaphorina citri]|nr:hypothetical protein M8J76_000501 [Diaphorina citri]
MIKLLSTRVPPLRKITKLGKNCVKLGSKHVNVQLCTSLLRSAFQQKFKILFLCFGICLVLYLSKTYSKAFSYIKPDLVIFLGDIMDEGHISHDEHFFKYLARVRQIFQLDNLAPHQRVLFLPGDNDVGGEEDEVSLNKLNRFNNHFNVTGLSGLSVYGGIQFVVVNKLARTYPSMAGQPNNTMRIVLSHQPVLTPQSEFGYEIISQLHPSLVMSGHEHTSTHIIWETLEDPLYGRSRVEEYISNAHTGSSLWRLNVEERSVGQEVVVPTCSYRMGVPHMAYGFMFIDKDRSIINYGLLWLPPRLFHIFLYIAYLVTACFISIFKYKTSSTDILNVRKYYHNV